MVSEPFKMTKGTYRFLKNNGKRIDIGDYTFLIVGDYTYYESSYIKRVRTKDFYRIMNIGSDNFNIDFYELTFLAQACIPQVPIARTMFWHRLVNDIYYQLSDNDRERMYEFMKRDMSENQLKLEDNEWFLDRYDKNNQYIVYVKYNNGLTEKIETFKHKDRYCVAINKWINKDNIIKTERKNNE